MSRGSVIENMCALFLEREGGAKRMPWRLGPSLVMATNKGGHSGVGESFPALFPDGTQGPTFERASMARGVDGAVQEEIGLESSICPELDEEPPLRQIIPQKHSRSGQIMKMNLRLKFTIACKKKPDARRAWRTSLPGQGRERESFI